MGPLRLATRGSPLALHQTDVVAQALRAGHPGLEILVQIIRTQGDDLSASLDQIGGQGVFVTAIEAAVAEGRADAAVHSAKDMTSTMAAGLVLAAVPPRADPRDGLVGCSLSALPAGGLVATGSARRRAQLAYARPDLSFTEIRGNMERRVSRGEDGSVSAVVVAVAAMERLGWMERLTDILDPLDMLPQAGQGAIAVQCRADDPVTRALLSAIDDPASHRAVRAERSVLAGLGGSCTVPVAAWAELVRDRREPSVAEQEPEQPELRVHGLVASGDGRVVVRMTRCGREPEEVGAALARALLVEGGGAEIDGFEQAAVSVRRP
jgi:hydroxymethylbilane synthase